MPPRPFGQYEVLARLAAGGAANIFLARQPGVAGFQKLVCLKTLLPERVRDAEFVAMFLDEARLAARLSHPNCVEIYDLGRERGTFYMSMEYIFGETLWALLATVAEVRVPLPAPVVASILASAAEGLHHAHELKDADGKPYNLVHRDVSPQNIMVTYEGQTKVLDFGIAKAETGRQATATGIVKGKFSYMSPEQITGGTIDRRSDLYSLGIVMFECLASRRLYRAETPEEIARMMLERRPPRLRDVVPDIHPELDAICAKALARHPSTRYSTARELSEALRKYLQSIHFSHDPANVAKLVQERFGPRIADRRRIFERALSGNYDESELLNSLQARPVMMLDLFPDGDAPDDDSSTAMDLLSGSLARDTQVSPDPVPEPRRMNADPEDAAEAKTRIDPDYVEENTDDFADAGPTDGLPKDVGRGATSRPVLLAPSTTRNLSDAAGATETSPPPSRRPLRRLVDPAGPDEHDEGSPTLPLAAATAQRPAARALEPPAMSPLAASAAAHGSPRIIGSPQVFAGSPAVVAGSPVVAPAPVQIIRGVVTGTPIAQQGAGAGPSLSLDVGGQLVVPVVSGSGGLGGAVDAVPPLAPAKNGAQQFSLSVVIAALIFGVTVGLLLGVLLMLYL